MRTAHLSAADDFDGWRQAARALAIERVPPSEVVWQIEGAPADLFAGEAQAHEVPAGANLTVPRGFIDLGQNTILHRDPERFGLLYALLLRLQDNNKLLEDRADPQVRRAEELAKAVRRDIHKMRAFLRFREVAEGEKTRFVAWFEPEHHIVRANARFFVNRFAALTWSILTPEISLHWDGALREGPGAERGDAPQDDPVEALWGSYYASIFNPARVKIGAMLKEMPKKYWKNMPETALVPQLIAGAQAREARMIEAARAQPGDNLQAAWEALRDEGKGCTRCLLYKPATQMVFGEGPVDAPLMFVGEQPGDQEDLAGRPFVGLAGQLFDRALAEAGVDRARAYVTNAVKHFKFEPRGKRRIHAKPDTGEIEACRWWIEQERLLLRPKVTVMLGATAARSLLGRAVTIGRERGRAFELAEGGTGWITVHPSFLLRIEDRARAEEEYTRFVADLRAAAGLLE
ncbi:MAG: UdgX family uracil-DNA binding protein [Sphingomonas sp.]|uniref:UdgX family uracil-DNA binding protein n=1 Tax=Sphingomonas sp. TaxID=28214 RepID=UPI0025EFAD16|nr:UdgX family uracil-DNA binding protein [Sphingomonas sp.]MBX9882923.1 UdgX family uracil-DNA binding protein [Sphingomonas sp.]